MIARHSRRTMENIRGAPAVLYKILNDIKRISVPLFSRRQ